MFKRIIALVVGILLAIGGIVMSEGNPDLLYTWTAPTEGSGVAYYRIEIDLNGEYEVIHGLIEREIAIPFPENGSLRLRGCAVDSMGRVSDWSGWSVVFVDAGAPGVPGVPILAN